MLLIYILKINSRLYFRYKIKFIYKIVNIYIINIHILDYILYIKPMYVYYKYIY